MRRFRVMEHYSGGEPKCECCGEDRLEFLCIDHVNGNGKQHRRELGHKRIVDWLEMNGFPEGFRVLCHNCNLSHGFYGYCPHVKGEKLRRIVEDYRADPPGRGSKHGMSKLTEAQVREIKIKLNSGSTLQELADEYGRCKATISHIKTGRQWKHVVV
jgi:hypothetical protein